jgi:hypothetical protein
VDRAAALLVLLAATLAAVVGAGPREPAGVARTTWPDLLPCHGTQFELDRCAQGASDRERRLLTRVLTDVGAHLTQQEQLTLAESETRWERYAASFCTGIDGGVGPGSGSIVPLLVANCTLVLTRQRIVDICQWAVPASTLDALARPPETCRPYHE